MSPASLDRRRFLALAGACTAGACASWQVGGASKTGRPRPNFILLLSDDQDWTGLSVAMDPAVPGSKSDYHRTPRLERLATQGMRFTSAYAPAPVCSPTRISLLTGKSPAQVGWTKASPVITGADGYKLIPPASTKSISSSAITIGELLRSAGYATAHYGKWHLRGRGPGRHGFDDHDGDTSNRDAAPFKDPNPVDIFGMAARAGAFMERCAKEKKPFYIQMSYHALHYAENACKKTLEACRKRTPGRLHRNVEVAAITEDLDRGIGVVLDRLDKLGLTANTYVVYMSDNGAGGRSPKRPLRGGKGSLWEGGIRVPMIVRGPGIKAGTVCRERVVGYDLFPTFCALAGVKKNLPPKLEGGNLASLFTGGKGRVMRPRQGLVFHFPHYQGLEGPHSAILKGDHKLIRFYETGEVHLFNLASDPGERRNLAPEMKEVAERLDRDLMGHLKEIGAGMPRPNPHYDPNNPPQRKRKGGRRKGRKAGRAQGQGR